MTSNELPSGAEPNNTPPQTPPADDLQPPPFLPKLPSRQNRGTDFSWLKWILAQNPFYIASAILLLYSMFRLSTDPKFFLQEISQLFFNLGSFQVYELMLAATAIVLARRKIYYDFSLLVCIETLFAFVPFILISHALLIYEFGTAAGLCFGVSALILLRFATLRKYFAEMNFGPRLLALGGVLLLVNMMLPLVTRSIHMHSTAYNRDIRLNILSDSSWLICMPLLTGLAMLLPQPRKLGSSLLQRRTFPLTAFGLWLVVTGAHLFCVDYIHQMRWSISLVVPTLWVASWMFFNRRQDVFETPNTKIEHILLLPAITITFIAAGASNWTMFSGLNLINALVFTCLLFKRRDPFRFQLLLFSVACVVAGLPDYLLGHLELRRSGCVGLALTAYVLFQTILSRSAQVGFLGAIVSGVACAVFFRDSDDYANIAGQLAGAFLLIHSLRWDGKNAESKALRAIGAFAWALHSLYWAFTSTIADTTTLWTTGCFGLAVIVVYFAVRVIFGSWGTRMVPYTALLVLVSDPIHRLLFAAKDTPVGLLILTASFVLFGLGTALALTRQRWHKPEVVKS